MLVLTRRVGETVVIEDDIEITVLSIQGKRIRLGIKAPSSVRVNRQEILERSAQVVCSLAEQASFPQGKSAAAAVPERAGALLVS